MKSPVFRILPLTISLLFVVFQSGAASAQGISIIRDAEIEHTLHAFASPLFRAAHIEPDAVRMYIINDNTLNAFVAGGQNMFINTGLILNAKTANEIVGVIAHETGHIAGGHLSRTGRALRNSSASSILSMVLGVAVGVVSGRGDVGAAIIAGGQSIAQRQFLKYSRTQEAAADHAALSYLDRTEQSSVGLLNFMERLGDQELISPERQDPYVQSHPLTRERIATVSHHMSRSPYAKTPEAPEFMSLFTRAHAKLYAFTYPFKQTLRNYPETDASIASRYARAIATFRKGKVGEAVALVDSLLAEAPNDPYFNELKGQILYEGGKPDAALRFYQLAAQLVPDSALILRDLARVQIDIKDPPQLDAAIINLDAALTIDPTTPFNWRLLAIAQGRKGDKGRSALALGEEALLIGKPSNARFHAGLAKTLFKEGSREWLQAEDILAAATELERTQSRNNR